MINTKEDLSAILNKMGLFSHTRIVRKHYCDRGMPRDGIPKTDEYREADSENESKHAAESSFLPKAPGGPR